MSEFAELIVLAVPMHRHGELQADLFAGKVFVDAMNYRPDVDGSDAALAGHRRAPAPSSKPLSASPRGQEPLPARLPRIRGKPA